VLGHVLPRCGVRRPRLRAPSRPMITGPPHYNSDATPFVANASNHAMERTADRCVFIFQMTSTHSPRATHVLVRRRSSLSR
jgi:hypothetical protein